MNNASDPIAELQSPDRNVRARAVKRLATHVSPNSSDAMLLALADPKRRVRETRRQVKRAKFTTALPLPTAPAAPIGSPGTTGPA